MLGVGSASATLIDNGNGLIYDTVLDITWTQDANLLGPNGFLTWAQANAWAANLVFDGVSGWRLATISSTSPDLNPVDCRTANAAVCAASGNELSYMFYYNLGGTYPQDLTGNQTAIGGVTLQNIQGDYWSGTAFTSDEAWNFYFLFGLMNQDPVDRNFQMYAWAVHDGRVPEPATLALLGLGLAGFGFSRRKRAS